MPSVCLFTSTVPRKAGLGTQIQPCLKHRASAAFQVYVSSRVHSAVELAQEPRLSQGGSGCWSSVVNATYLSSAEIVTCVWELGKMYLIVSGVLGGSHLQFFVPFGACCFCCFWHVVPSPQESVKNLLITCQTLS